MAEIGVRHYTISCPLLRRIIGNRWIRFYVAAHLQITATDDIYTDEDILNSDIYQRLQAYAPSIPWGIARQRDGVQQNLLLETVESQEWHTIADCLRQYQPLGNDYVVEAEITD